MQITYMRCMGAHLMCAVIYTHIHTHAPPYTHTFTHSHTHLRARIYTHIRPPTQTVAPSLLLSFPRPLSASFLFSPSLSFSPSLAHLSALGASLHEAPSYPPPTPNPPPPPPRPAPPVDGGTACNRRLRSVCIVGSSAIAASDFMACRIHKHT